MQGGKNAERNESKPVLLRHSLAGNVEKPLLSLFGTKWREHGYEYIAPVCINFFRQNPVFTSLHLRSPVHVVPPLKVAGSLSSKDLFPLSAK
jgi:hypothetical protein